MKAIDQYVTVVLYISLYKVVLGFESLGELPSPKCKYLNKAFLQCLTVMLLVSQHFGKCYIY